MDTYLIVVALVAVIATVAYLLVRSNKKTSTSPGGVSAFAKIVDADLKAKTAEGKIIAAKAAAEAHTAVAAAQKQAALEAHAAIDGAHSAFDEVHEILG